MVIGVVSSTQSHVQLIKDAIATRYDFTHVTERDIVAAIGIGKLVNADKAPLLDSLQDTYGNVLISGDALWSEALCQHLLTNLRGSLLIDITLPKPGELPYGQYWGYEGIMDWAIQSQSKRAPQHDGSVIYLDVDNSQFQFNMTALLETIQQHDDRRDVVNVSMEDVIKRAMKDLGIEPPPTQVTAEVEEATPEEQPEETTVEETVEIVAQHPIEMSAVPHPTIVSTPEDLDISPTVNDSQVFLKMKDGTMALFIPVNTQLPAQVIGGVEYHTLVFTAPDLGNTGLQPLKIQNAVTPSVHRRPIVTPQVTVESSDLQQLIAQKVQLDQSIKDARAAKDEATVAELRKQRRLIRRRIRQINAIGGSANVTTQD